MILTDAEFAAYVSPGPATQLSFDKSSDTKTVMDWVGKQIALKKITKMYLIAHGISVSNKGSSLGMSMEGNYSLPEKIGGYGISIGDTPIGVDNDHLFKAWGRKGLKSIVMLSCGIVNGDGQGNWGDGRTLCQHIATYTGATVYASDTVQCIGTDWQGDVFKFSPNMSTGGTRVARPYPALLERVDN